MAHKGSYHRPKPGDKGRPPPKVYGPKRKEPVLQAKSSRKVDVFAGSGVAKKLKDHRDELEKGNPRGKHPKPGRRK